MPQIRYARSSGAKIAFRVTGTGPVDVVMVPGLLSHLELDWQNPRYRRFSSSLARASRLIQFDKRGTGLSDPTAGLPTIAERRECLAALTVPTLVLHRQGDVIPVEHGRAVAARIPTVRLVVLPGRDHLTWVGDWAAL